MDQFTFYDLYYETFNGLKDEEIGRFIKRICNYALYDLEDEASKNDTENCLFEIIFPTLKEATLLEKQGKVPYYLNRSMKHFTFKIAYANIIKTIKDEKLSGKFIKAICAYMFDDEIPVDLTPPIDTYFKLFKKSFDLTKTRIKSGYKGGSKKKKEIINKKIEKPIEYFHNKGMSCNQKPKGEYFWRHASVVDILENPSYLGHTVNFKYVKKSHKSKKKTRVSKDNWLIFENTHEPIIDKETFDIVQKIRQGKRRIDSTGVVHMLSGMLYCSDCGKKLYINRRKKEHLPDYYNCSTYKEQTKSKCTGHLIMVDKLEQIVLDDLRYTINYSKEHKDIFLEIVKEHNETKTNQELKLLNKTIKETKERIVDLDRIIQVLYEDKIKGYISEERFLKMNASYEEEQATLKVKLATLLEEHEKNKSVNNNINQFIELVEKYSDITELTTEITHAFIDKIIVHEKMKLEDGFKQELEIIYNFIGAVDIPRFDNLDELD